MGWEEERHTPEPETTPRRSLGIGRSADEGTLGCALPIRHACARQGDEQSVLLGDRLAILMETIHAVCSEWPFVRRHKTFDRGDRVSSPWCTTGAPRI